MLNKKTVLAFTFCILSFQSFCQEKGRTLLLGGLQLDFGSPLNTYALHRTALSSKILSNHMQGALSIQLRLWDRIGIEAGASQSMQHWQMRDKAFERRHQGYKVDLRNTNYYYSFFGNIQLYQKLISSTYLYLEGGYFLNLAGSNTLTQTKVFVKNNETFTATSVYNPQNISISTGVGIQKIIRERHVISIGLRLNLGRENMMNGTYTVVDNTGTTITNDKYISKGSFAGLNVKYSLVLARHYKKIKTPKPIKEEPIELPVVIKDPTPPVVHKDTLPTQIEGRKLEITHKVEVSKKMVTIKVWDHEKIDGDRISLNLNGKWILINYTLQKEQKVIQVELNEGENIFVLHALNLGKYPPNTAAIIIDDGTKENEVVLESTLETSGTIQINCNPK